jgi:hypothetical protein
MADVVISDQQVTLHMVSELGGVLVTVPFFLYASKRLPTEPERNAALLMGVGALVVDGFLLWRYLSRTTHKPIL